MGSAIRSAAREGEGVPGLESEVFARMKPDFSRFPAAGFARDAETGVWKTRVALRGGEFYAVVTVADGGEVAGRVYDADTDDEYLAVRVASQSGAFVASVRRAYIDALRELARACFAARMFRSDQADRIAARITAELGAQAEEPWGGGEGAVFRDDRTRRWFAVILRVARAKLVPGADGETEIMNVKVPPSDVPALCRERGVFRCYHMNKKHWVSLALDGTLADEHIMRLARESAAFAARGPSAGTRKDAPASVGAWIVPANYAYWDVEKHFGENPVQMWKQTSAVRPGDTVFIYISAPVSAIWCRCRVLETDIPADYDDGNITIKKMMRLEMTRRYGRGLITLDLMRRRGVRAARSARRVTPELLDEIARLEAENPSPAKGGGAKARSRTAGAASKKRGAGARAVKKRD